VEEASSTLKHAIDQFELDPQRLKEIDQRMGLIHQLARKHHVPANELPALTRKLSEELDGLSEADVQISLMEEELEKLKKGYSDLAGKLSKARAKGTKKLASEINLQLSTLGMMIPHREPAVWKESNFWSAPTPGSLPGLWSKLLPAASSRASVWPFR